MVHKVCGRLQTNNGTHCLLCRSQYCTFYFVKQVNWECLERNNNILNETIQCIRLTSSQNELPHIRASSCNETSFEIPISHEERLRVMTP